MQSRVCRELFTPAFNELRWAPQHIHLSPLLAPKSFQNVVWRVVYLTNSLFISAPMGPSRNGLFEVQIVIKQLKKNTIWSDY